MEIKQLITFKTAAENLNFTQTAKILNFAQSSVTSQIKTLEEELGTLLFERLGKRLVLTEEGKVFKVYADRMVAMAEEASLAVLGTTEPVGTIVIGASESQCTYRLPPILKKFNSQFPRVKMIFHPAHSDEEAREKLLNGSVDLAFLMGVPKPGNALTVEPLVKECMRMVVAPEHPLLLQPEVLPSDLEEETMLLTRIGCSYRAQLEESFLAAGISPSKKFEFASIEAVKQCVIARIGIAYLPSMAVEKELQAGQLKELTWQYGFDSQIYTQIAWHRDKWITTPLKAFIDCTREAFQTSSKMEPSSVSIPY